MGELVLCPACRTDQYIGKRCDECSFEESSWFNLEITDLDEGQIQTFLYSEREERAKIYIQYRRLIKNYRDEVSRKDSELKDYGRLKSDNSKLRKSQSKLKMNFDLQNERVIELREQVSSLERNIKSLKKNASEREKKIVRFDQQRLKYLLVKDEKNTYFFKYHLLRIRKSKRFSIDDVGEVMRSYFVKQISAYLKDYSFKIKKIGKADDIEELKIQLNENIRGSLDQFLGRLSKIYNDAYDKLVIDSLGKDVVHMPLLKHKTQFVTNIVLVLLIFYILLIVAIVAFFDSGYRWISIGVIVYSASRIVVSVFRASDDNNEPGLVTSWFSKLFGKSSNPED
ncbi:MAG: hypothetical protein Roseis2KO_41720 [Roseivirga sp.]